MAKVLAFGTPHFNVYLLQLPIKGKAQWRFPLCVIQWCCAVCRCRQELQELKAMNNDAQIARDAAKQDLELQERQVYEERRRRELELAQVRKEADEKRQQHERIERRIVSIFVHINDKVKSSVDWYLKDRCVL